MSATPYTDKLSPQQRMFVMEYLRDTMSGPAAERMGLSRSQGYKLMGQPEVLAALDEQTKLRSERVGYDADWVLQQLGDMFNADLADIVYPGTNTLRPIHEWPPVWRKMTTSVKISAMYEGRGDERQQIGELQDVKIMDRLKALEMIGKHTDVKAFTERHEVITSQALVDELSRARKRAAQRNNPTAAPSFL